MVAFAFAGMKVTQALPHSKTVDLEHLSEYDKMIMYFTSRDPR